MASNSTDSALQNAPTSFFAQLIEQLPKARLLAHFDKHCLRRSATKFSAWDHFKSWFLSEALLSRMKVQQRQKPSAPTLSFVIFAGVIDGNASDPLVIDYA